ncbi:MAG TPA: ribonuclease III [Thermomicrobiaceae bacterium]|nr:ribonuclease III [Thermomicrobiaceae bacterium]
MTEPDGRPERAARAIGIQFNDPDLLQLALTHRSYLNEQELDQVALSLLSNERLEFLGDSLVGMITAEFLFRHFPSEPEGPLTAYRTSLVRTETLAGWARRFQLDECLYLGRGEMIDDEPISDRILAGAFEAVVAAIYLDRGIRRTRAFLNRLLRRDAEAIISLGRRTNYKGRLQELAQDRLHITPAYKTTGAQGPAHDRIFTVAVFLGDDALATGTGSSKRAAQQDAAQQALAALARQGVVERGNGAR